MSLNGPELLSGIDLTSFEALGGPMSYLEGGPFRGPDDMIVDDIYAKGNNVHVGSFVNALNRDFRVCGVTPHGRGSRRYVPIKTMQELMTSENKASVFYVRLDDTKNDSDAAR